MTEAIDQPFWAALAEGVLRLPRCTACHRWTWPPEERCGSCGSWDMDWEDVAMQGLVHSFTWVRHPFTPAMADRVPFANLLVELPQAGGARLIGVLEAASEAAAGRLEIGAPVIGEIVPDADGEAVLRWSLAP